MHREADRLTNWAQNRGETYDQLVTESTTRSTLGAQRAGAERSERAQAAVAAVSVDAAVATVDTAEAEQAYDAAVNEEAAQGRSA